MGKNTKNQQALLSLSVLLSLLGAATCIGYLFRWAGFPETNIVIVFILATLMAARLTSGYAYGVIASVAATTTFNFFFIEPRFTFVVNDPSYIITFVIMTITALITSALTTKERKSAQEAKEKEAETSALYQLANRLTDAQDIEGIVETAVSAISDAMDCNAACLCFDSLGAAGSSYYQQRKPGKLTRLVMPDEAEIASIRQRADSLRAGFDMGEEFYDFPIIGQEGALGVIRIPSGRGRQLDEKQLRLLYSMVRNTALALDRLYSAQERLRSQEEAERERLRANFLRSISHDLRTPLTGISGSAGLLLSNADMLAEETKAELYADIHEDAMWLGNLVENLLSITRIENDRLSLNMQPELLSEVIEEALSHVSRQSAEHQITVEVADEFLMAGMEASLIVQVIVNMVDNAIKHTLPGSQITVSAVSEAGKARVEVADDGEGVSDEAKARMFDMVYVADPAPEDRRGGMGLGLYLCKAIIDAHGGEIYVRDNAPRGAVFGFVLQAEEVGANE